MIRWLFEIEFVHRSLISFNKMQKSKKIKSSSSSLSNSCETKSKKSYKRTYDRDYMNEQMQIHIDYLKKNNITKYEDVHNLCHCYRFEAKDEKQMIKFFEKHLKYQEDFRYHQFYFLTNRGYQKSNSEQRNIIFNRILYEFGEEFITFLKNYLQDKYSRMMNQEIFIDKIKELMEKITNSPAENNFTFETSPPSFTLQASSSSYEQSDFYDEMELAISEQFD